MGAPISGLDSGCSGWWKGNFGSIVQTSRCVSMISRFDSAARLAAACARNSRRLGVVFRSITASMLTCYRMRDFTRPGRTSVTEAGASHQRRVENFLNQRVVADACGGRRLREILIRGQRRIRIGFDNEYFTRGGEPHVNAPEPADLEQPVNLAAQISQVLLHALRQWLGRSVLDAPLLAIPPVPFRVEGGEFWNILRHLLEENLPRRKNGQPGVSYHADLDLAALYVLLDLI